MYKHKRQTYKHASFRVCDIFCEYITVEVAYPKENLSLFSLYTKEKTVPHSM